VAIWPSRSSKSSSNKHIGQSKKVGNIRPYHCVEVDMPYDACEEVLKLHSVRFLPAEAPILPLSGCDQHCTCKYKHHNDRRQGERRDVFSASGIHFSGGGNRRLGDDRRHSAHNHISLR